MKNDSFSDRLNLVLDQEGYPPKNRGRIQLLANLVDLSHRGASKWVNGESCPPAKKFPDLAKKLNVNAIWLRTGQGFMRDDDNNEKNTHPLLIREPTEVAIYSHSKLMTNHTSPLKTILCYLKQEGHFFGIILDSEAMAPRFPNESLLIFERKTPIKDGDFILVDFKAYPEPVFRQAFIAGSTTYLMASNPKFEQLTLRTEDKILGRLVQVIYAFD